MPDRQRKWLDMIRRLDATYSVGGTAALGKMTAIEAQLLYAEKMAELNTVSKSLVRHPHDELAQLRKEKLERETAEIGGWMKKGKHRVAREFDLDKG